MNLVEVFSSVQGEGPEVGSATLFVRFGGCDLRCRWCDSPHTWRPQGECRIEKQRGSGKFRTIPNPVSSSELVAAAKRLEAPAHRWVSLTGGEPLLQPEAAAELARALRALGPGTWLETHGLEVEGLAGVLPWVDVVSMDWKLASDVRREGERASEPAAPFHDRHEAFLARAVEGAKVVVKLVITPASTDPELDEAFARIARTAPGTTLVLQPVTPFAGVRERPTAERMLALAKRAGTLLSDVRVIPQTHPVLGAP